MPSLPLLLLLASIAAVTLWAWRERHLEAHLALDMRSMAEGGQWYRLLSHGWLHVDGLHLGMNLLVLFIFASGLEMWLGPEGVVVVFVIGVLAGGWLSWLIHQGQDYASVGASAGVCAVVFGSIAVAPDVQIMSIFIPIGIPGWIFGVLYLVGSFVQARANHGDVSHDGHFGGAVAGLLVTFVWVPRVCLESPWRFGTVTAVALIGLYWFWRNPLGLPMQAFSVPRFESKAKASSGPVVTSAAKQQAELDALLEKISEHGMAALSEVEQRRLATLSAELKRRRLHGR